MDHPFRLRQIYTRVGIFPLPIMIYFSLRQVTKWNSSITGRTQFYVMKWAKLPDEQDSKARDAEQNSIPARVFYLPNHLPASSNPEAGETALAVLAG